VITRFGRGKEPKIFWSPLRGERVTRRDTGETSIQMGDWYSEELIPKLNETAAMVRKSITARTSTRKFHFLVSGWAFSLDGEPSNG
jgi:hypothetical protein